MKNYQGSWVGLILLAVLLLCLGSELEAGEVIVSWNPNSEADLLGYKVYWGRYSRIYTNNENAGNQTTYKISNLTEGVKYFFAVTAYDTAFNESDFSIEVSYTIPLNDTTGPHITSVTLLSATALDLSYDEKVEQSSAENKSNYQISSGIGINSIILDSNQQVVHISTSAHQPGTYHIVVNNVTDLSHNPIESNSSQVYQFIPQDTIPPIITAVKILDATHVDVTFSEAVKKATAEQVQNFRINNGISVLQANLDQNNPVVHLLTSSHLSGNTYTLTVNNVCDLATSPNFIAPNSSKNYEYLEIDTTPPSLYSVKLRNETLLDVLFSESVEQTSAERIGNYQINNGVNVLAAVLDINQTTVHLSTTAHPTNGVFTLTVNNIIDRAHPPNMIAPNSSANYQYQPDDHIPPALIGAYALNDSQVDLSFSEAIDRESAEAEKNYQIDKGIRIIEALIDNNKTTVHLTTTPHQTGETYTLTVSNIKDLAATPNVIGQNSRITYNYVYQDTEPPQIDSLQMVYTTYIKIFFNEPLEQESAEKASNYGISGGIKVLNAILDNNFKIVQLTTSEHQFNTAYRLAVNNVRDRSSNRNRIAANTIYDYQLDVAAGTSVLGLSQAHYELAYLDIGDEYYMDRSYTIKSLPSALSGCLWIKTANDDRDRKDANFLSFQLREPTRIYVAYDSRALKYPNWLVNHFNRTSHQVRVSEYADRLVIWEQQCKAGVVTLGANLAEGADGAESMYVVLIELPNGKPPGLPENMADPASLGPANMFLLYQNYPNPFNAETEIRIQLPKDGYVELAVYNLFGQTIKTLAQGYLTAGHHIFKWDGKQGDGIPVPTGTYFSRLTIKKLDTAEDTRSNSIVYHHVRKMIMVK